MSQAQAVKGTVSPKSDLRVGTWYVDESLCHDGRPLNARFQVLALGTDTLQVLDAFGERRTVNRLMFESQMSVAKRQPM